MTSLQNNKPVSFQNILVIGLGVMGGSFVKSLQSTNCVLYGIDTNADICEQVKMEQGIKIITYTMLNSLPKMDLVIVTVMPKVVPEIFSILDAYLSRETLVIEISGVKQKLAEIICQKKWNFNYMLTHPMAGRENGGYAYSRSTLFVGANFLLIDDCYTASNKQIEKLYDFIAQIGASQVLMMSAVAHDEQITYTSQLSHVLASSLLLSEDYAPTTKSAIGDSFRDLTRIANMNVPMWNELFFENKELLGASIDHLVVSLLEMKQDILDENEQDLTSKLALAKSRRQSFK